MLSVTPAIIIIKTATSVVVMCCVLRTLELLLFLIAAIDVSVFCFNFTFLIIINKNFGLCHNPAITILSAWLSTSLESYHC